MEKHCRGKEACDAALHRKLKESEDDQPMHRLRAAKDDDGVLIDKRFVMIRLPAFSEPGREFPEISCRVLWQIKGANVWLELTEATVTYVLAALRVSERFVKQKKLRGSPKRRRKLRRRASESLPRAEEEETIPYASWCC